MITDHHEDGSPAFTFEPWTDGHAVGYRVTRHADNHVTFVYLNPSQETWTDGDFSPDVFLYIGANGDPAQDDAVHFYNVGNEEKS